MKVQYHSEILGRSFNTAEDCLKAEEAAQSFKSPVNATTVQEVIDGLSPLGDVRFVPDRRGNKMEGYFAVTLNNHGRDVQRLKCGPNGRLSFSLSTFPKVQAVLSKAMDLRFQCMDAQHRNSARRRKVVSLRRAAMATDPEVAALRDGIAKLSTKLKELSITHDKRAEAAIPHEPDNAATEWDTMPELARKIVKMFR